MIDTTTALYTVPAAEPLQSSEVGAKAASLARLAAAGFAVPPAVILPPGLSLDDAIASIESTAVETLGPGPYAVRSSASVEDGPLRSFAGQFETVLGVDRADLATAIEQVRASARALRVVAYAGTSIESIAVIVQRQLSPRCAGVAFTADPDSGERGVLRIEAVSGLGDRLVSGEADPEAWTVQQGDVECTRRVDASVLSREDVMHMTTTFRAAEAAFGHPLDIEWAIADGQLYLLQARPITRLPAAPIAMAVDVPVGEWDRDDHHAVLTPLGWAWIQPYAPAMSNALRAVGLPIKRMEMRLVAGRLYGRMVGAEGGGAPPRWVLWLVSRILPSLRRANRVAQSNLDGTGFLDDMHRWQSVDRPAFRTELEALDVPDPRNLDDDILLDRIRAAMALCTKGLSMHAHLHMPGFFGLGRLALFLEDELGWSKDRTFELVSGSSHGTTSVFVSLSRVLDAHRDEVDAVGGLPPTWPTLLRDCPTLGAALARWLQDNRLHMQHYEPGNPSLGEQPQLVLAALAGLLQHQRDHGDIVRQANALADEALRALPADRHEAFRRVLADARAIYGLRDENGIELVSKPAGLLRHFVLELGRRLGHSLEAPEHAVFLTPDEHGPALRGQLADLAERIRLRRGHDSWARRQSSPRRFGKPKAPMPNLAGFPEPLHRLMRVFDWLDLAETLPLPSDAPDQLTGVGIGNRIVVARARVLRGPEEMGLLRMGEVAVCRITSPEWTLGLSRAAALVTDEGGALSHPAIIARELGIPAVLGSEHATKRLSTGDRVEVDPIAATVRRLSTPEPAAASVR